MTRQRLADNLVGLLIVAVFAALLFLPPLVCGHY